MTTPFYQIPTVQLIGAQKAGTSAIADWLFSEGNFQRPRVFEGEPWYFSKEVHFFDSNERFSKGLNFYKTRYHPVGPCLDATPDTLQFAERVHSIYTEANMTADLRIIVILRDPILRELSLYNHLAFDCRTLAKSELTSWHEQVQNDDGSIMTFDEFVDQISIPALSRKDGQGQSSRHGLYVNHLREWFDLFNRDQILVLNYTELCEHPEKLSKRIEQFLGRTVVGSLKRSNVNDNPYKVKFPSAKARRKLATVFDPLNEELYKLLNEFPGPAMEERPYPNL